MPSVLWQLQNIHIQPGSLPEIQAFIYNCLIDVSSWMAKWHLRPNKFKPNSCFSHFKFPFQIFAHFGTGSSILPGVQTRNYPWLFFPSHPAISKSCKLHLKNASTFYHIRCVYPGWSHNGFHLDSSNGLLTELSAISMLLSLFSPHNTQSDPVKRGSHHIPPLSNIFCVLYSIKPSVQMTSYQRALLWSPY